MFWKIEKQKEQTLRSLPVYPSVMVASSLKSRSSVFSFDMRVFKILSLLSIDGRPTIILPDTKNTL
jgi:hypothetical protein